MIQFGGAVRQSLRRKDRRMKLQWLRRLYNRTRFVRAVLNYDETSQHAQ